MTKDECKKVVLDIIADIGCECVGDPPVNVLKEAVQCGVDDTLKFAFRRKFQTSVPEIDQKRAK